MLIPDELFFAAPVDIGQAVTLIWSESDAHALSLGISFVHVTHSQDEAMALADLVVVMEAGHIRQWFDFRGKNLFTHCS